MEKKENEYLFKDYGIQSEELSTLAEIYFEAEAITKAELLYEYYLLKMAEYGK